MITSTASAASAAVAANNAAQKNLDTVNNNPTSTAEEKAKAQATAAAAAAALVKAEADHKKALDLAKEAVAKEQTAKEQAAKDLAAKELARREREHVTSKLVDLRTVSEITGMKIKNLQDLTLLPTVYNLSTSKYESYINCNQISVEGCVANKYLMLASKNQDAINTEVGRRQNTAGLRIVGKKLGGYKRKTNKKKRTTKNKRKTRRST